MLLVAARGRPLLTHIGLRPVSTLRDFVVAAGHFSGWGGRRVAAGTFSTMIFGNALAAVCAARLVGLVLGHGRGHGSTACAALHLSDEK